MNNRGQMQNLAILVVVLIVGIMLAYHTGLIGSGESTESESIDPEDYDLSQYSKVRLEDSDTVLVAFDDDIGQYREYDPKEGGTKTIDLEVSVALAKEYDLWDTWKANSDIEDQI